MRPSLHRSISIRSGTRFQPNFAPPWTNSNANRSFFVFVNALRTFTDICVPHQARPSGPEVRRTIDVNLTLRRVAHKKYPHHFSMSSHRPWIMLPADPSWIVSECNRKFPVYAADTRGARRFCVHVASVSSI